MLHQAWQWYQTSGLSASTICIPSMEALVLLVVLTLCLLFHMTRAGLVTAYIFTYYWGMLFGKQNFAGDPRVYNIFITSYIVFGILALTLVLIAMLMTRHSDRQE